MSAERPEVDRCGGGGIGSEFLEDFFFLFASDKETGISSIARYDASACKTVFSVNA